MQEQDLLQIKKIIDDSLEEKLESKLEEKLESKLEEKLESKLEEKLESKLEEKFRENNEKIFVKIDEVITTTKEQFDENTNQLEEIRAILKTKANESTVLSWGDERITPVKNDVDKLKFLHRNEWKGLPNSGAVSRILAEEGIKS